MENELKAGDVVEINGKKYRAESEVEKGTCIGCDLFDDGKITCGYWVPRCIPFIFKEVKDVPRHLELGVVKVKGDKVTFRIVEQTHRGENFSQQTATDTFKAANGIKLGSRNIPDWTFGSSSLFCRGFSADKDNIEIVCTASEFARISEAVSEYNATDSRGYEKPWPQSGDIYFYIAAHGRIEYVESAEDPFDTDCRACNNFFRTREEAEAARDKVGALLKELAAK